MEPTLKPLSRREKAKQATREKAITAAKALWAEPGSYTTNGIREIAKHMGMSTGAIFANFASKDVLWWVAFDSPPPIDSALTRAALKRWFEVGVTK